MKKDLLNSTLFLLLLSCSAVTNAGFDRGNGTDYVRFEDRGAWFTGAGRKISYCVEVSRDFGVNKSVAEAATDKAFKEWTSYSKKHNYSNGIVFEGILQSACTEATDLKFYFGLTEQPQLKSHAENLTDRLAAAVRTSSDLNRGWSQGFIYIAAQGTLAASEVDAERPKNLFFPDWQAPNTLYALLLHELGHVFGNEHTAETIMDEKLSLAILNYKTHALELSGIDGRRELLALDAPHEGMLGLPFVPAAKGYHACRDEVPFNFELLTGRKSVGPVKVTFEIVNELSPYLRTGFLHLKDDEGIFKIALEFFPGSPVLAGQSSKVFNVIRMVNGHPQGRWTVHSSSAKSFRIKSFRGDYILGTYEHNLNSAFQYGPTDYTLTGEVLKYMTVNGPKILFFTSAPKETGWSDGRESNEPENCTAP